MTLTVSELSALPRRQKSLDRRDIKSGTGVERSRMNLGLKSSPGFREKLAEREEAIASCKALVAFAFLQSMIIWVLVH